VLLAAALTAVAVAWSGAPGLAAGLLAVPAWWLAERAYAALGHTNGDGLVVARSGLLTRTTAYVPVDRLQSVEVRASPLQRRLRLATLHLQLAHPPGMPDPAMYDLDAGRALPMAAALTSPPSWQP
jgi:putative membrane protein